MSNQGLAFGNDHCFEDSNRQFWLDQALGFSTVEILDSRDQRQFYFLEREDDGFFAQNGGIQRPQEVKIRRGQTMVRFMSASAYQRFQANGLMGGWWMDYDGFCGLRAFAHQHEHSLAEAANILLAIPAEWSDCAYVGKAEVLTTLRAWVGQGKPATGSISPGRAPSLMPGKGGSRLEWEASGASLHAPPPSLEVKQYFIPGKRELLSSAFNIINVEPAA